MDQAALAHHTALFFYGSLRDTELLDIVLGGTANTLTCEPARAIGFKANRVARDSFPMIFEAPGAEAEGIVVAGFTPEQLARVQFFEDADYELKPITVEVAGGAVQAQVFSPTERLSDSGQAWSFERWQREDKALLIACAEEQMSYFGHVAQPVVERWWPDIKARAEARLGIASQMPTIRQPFSRADVEEIETVEIHREYFTMQDRTVRFSTYDGGRSAPVKRGVFISGEAVTVLPYDAARDEVLLIEQWRVGPWVYGDANPWAIEVIAGRLEGDTHPERTARREAREEAGVEIAEMEHAAGYYTTPGIGCEYLTSYVGRADLSAAGGVHGLEEEGENIRVITLGFWDAMEALARGDVNTAPAVLSLLWLARNRERLRLLWS